MKNTIAALICTIALTATPVSAGSLSDPIVTPEVVAADTTQNSSNLDGLVLAVWSLLLMAALGGAL